MNRRTFAKRSLFSTAGLLAAPYVNSSLAVSSLSLIKVLDLQTDRRINPMGLEEHHLAFSWRIEHEDFQSGWQIQVASTLHNLESSLGDLWDSGWNTGAESSNISYAGESLS